MKFRIRRTQIKEVNESEFRMTGKDFYVIQDHVQRLHTNSGVKKITYEFEDGHTVEFMLGEE